MIVRSVFEHLCIPGKADASGTLDGDKRKRTIRLESVRCSDRQTTDFSKLGSWRDRTRIHIFETLCEYVNVRARERTRECRLDVRARTRSENLVGDRTRRDSVSKNSWLENTAKNHCFYDNYRHLVPQRLSSTLRTCPRVFYLTHSTRRQSGIISTRDTCQICGPQLDGSHFQSPGWYLRDKVRKHVYIAFKIID